MIRVLFAGDPAGWDAYRAALMDAFAAEALEVDLARDHAPEVVDWIVHSPAGPLTDFTPYVRARGVLGLWAGVEHVVRNPTLTQPLTRMVDPSLSGSMVEWVTGHVLRHHLGMDAHIVNPDRVWDDTSPPPAGERRVGILGLGALGTACAAALAALGFDVAGWARRQRDIRGVSCHHGPDGFRAILGQSDIAVLLLPATPATDGLMGAEALAMLPRGAVLLNPARGQIVDDGALIAALVDGHLSHATLDAFRTEPLPRDHPFWAHPRVTVTPHVAAATRPVPAARVIARNVRRGEDGLPLLHLVDRAAGY